MDETKHRRDHDLVPGEHGTIKDVMKYLKRMDIFLMRPHDLETNIAPEFSDGVKLCLLVQKCELMRGALPGVNVEPKNQAQVSVVSCSFLGLVLSLFFLSVV